MGGGGAAIGVASFVSSVVVVLLAGDLLGLPEVELACVSLVDVTTVVAVSDVEFEDAAEVDPASVVDSSAPSVVLPEDGFEALVVVVLAADFEVVSASEVEVVFAEDDSFAVVVVVVVAFDSVVVDVSAAFSVVE